MAKIHVPYLFARPCAAGVRWFWEPSGALRKAGFKGRPLGRDEDAAVRAAKALNKEVDAWRAGAATPENVREITQRHTVDAVIAAFKEARYPRLKDKTQVEYTSKLKVISRWAGKERIDSITLANIRQFRDALYAPRKGGVVKATTAFNTLKVLRSLWAWALENEYIAVNPAAKDLDLETPAPRHQFASALARQALLDAAVALDRPVMAAAMILAWTIGQREEDLLKVLQSRYDEIQPYEADDPAVYARLAAAEPDGRVMGIRLRQGKTDRWIGVPIVRDARLQMEAAIARARELKLTTILFDEERQQTWTAGPLKERRIRQMYFQRAFARIRAHAATTVRAAGDDELADEITDLQFRDFRRTCVVTMGQRGIPDHLIAAITGHKLDTVKKILEVYLPRTTGMAMLAMDLTHERAPRQIGREAKTA